MEAVDPSFAPLMKAAYDKLTLLDHFSERLKLSDFGPDGRRAATQYIRGVYGDSSVDYLRALNDLDAHFSTGLRGKLVDRAILSIRQASIGSRIGNRGLGEMLPRVTSGGHIRSAAAMVGGGFMMGGPVGAVVGGAMASPKLILRATPAMSRLGGLAQSATSALARVHLGGATRVLTTGVIDAANVEVMRQAIRAEGGGSKQVARQDGDRRPRRRIVIGS